MARIGCIKHRQVPTVQVGNDELAKVVAAWNEEGINMFQSSHDGSTFTLQVLGESVKNPITVLEEKGLIKKRGAI